MNEKIFARLRDWVEPAHPGVVQLFDDLISIYQGIRGKQGAIDKAFDEVSRQIGFVITTTVPVVLEIGDRGMVKGISMGAEHLKGTLFDKALTAALRDLKPPETSPWRAGSYSLYILWADAFKLKLRTDWMEPAHFVKDRFLEGLRPDVAARVPARPIPWVEPAHWFDPGIAIAVEEAVLIEAIDEVYPEFKLVERIASMRAALRRPVRPEVKEPAHFRRFEHRFGSETPEE